MKKRFKKVDLGIAYMILAQILFALMGICVKKLGQEIDAIELVFFRSLFVFALAFIMFKKSSIVQVGGRAGLLLFRAMAGFLGMMFFFYNITIMSLGDAMTYSRLSAIFVAFFAAMFLKERLGKMGWLAVFIGFLGVIFVAQPNQQGFSQNAFTGLLSAICAAVAYTAVRELNCFYDAKFIVVIFAMVTTFMSALVMFLGQMQVEWLSFLNFEFVVPSWENLVYILLMGIFATYAQLLMTRAYALSKAGVMAVISYFNIFFAMVLGSFIFDDALPDFLGLMGILLIITGGFMASYSHKR